MIKAESGSQPDIAFTILQKSVLEKAKKEDAEAAKKTLEDAGCTVELA